MRTPYKLEIFDRNIDFKDTVIIGEPTISFDYLTLEKSRVTTPMINAARGDYAHITDLDGRVVYQGIIDDYAAAEGTCTLHIKPLLSLFNIKALRVSAATVEGEIAGIINAEYVNNADTLQNIPMTVATTSATIGSLTVDSGIVDLYSIITAALSAYGIVVSAELKPQDKIIAVEIGVQDGSVTLEADTPNVINKNIVIGDSFGALNKLTLINEADETQRVTYYLHTDGTVNTTNNNRVWPVFASVEYINSKDFAEKAEERALKALTPQKYDNLIELTYSRDDKLVNAESLKIGDVADIRSGDNTYKGILTGYEISSGTIKLIFGIVRIDLVKKLILQKRASDAARLAGRNDNASGNIRAIAAGHATATPDGATVSFPAGRFTNALRIYILIGTRHIIASGDAPSVAVSVKYQTISTSGFTAVVPSGQPNTYFSWTAIELY